LILFLLGSFVGELFSMIVKPEIQGFWCMSIGGLINQQILMQRVLIQVMILCYGQLSNKYETEAVVDSPEVPLHLIYISYVYWVAFNSTML